jgi:site-specific recombinase XerD
VGRRASEVADRRRAAIPRARRLGAGQDDALSSGQATFKRAGIEAGRTGGRTLRNSYAVDAIDKGVPNFELRDILGLAEVESVALYSNLAKNKKADN